VVQRRPFRTLKLGTSHAVLCHPWRSGVSTDRHQRSDAASEDEVLGALDADQRETLYQLLAQATTRHVVDCTVAVRAEVALADGC
jgi:hypothetical protein